ncbi:MAG: hypothetical protein NW201_09130 [Gemmatimonadales bacterium]|nr:hypothetical protein [Gemmatimonadales bacterium]
MVPRRDTISQSHQLGAVTMTGHGIARALMLLALLSSALMPRRVAAQAAVAFGVTGGGSGNERGGGVQLRVQGLWFAVAGSAEFRTDYSRAFTPEGTLGAKAGPAVTGALELYVPGQSAVKPFIGGVVTGSSLGLQYGPAGGLAVRIGPRVGVTLGVEYLLASQSYANNFGVIVPLSFNTPRVRFSLFRF